MLYCISGSLQLQRKSSTGSPHHMGTQIFSSYTGVVRSSSSWERIQYTSCWINNTNIVKWNRIEYNRTSQWPTRTAKSSETTSSDSEMMGATSIFPEEARAKASLARDADGLRQSLPASQKIWNINEGNTGLPPVPASLNGIDGVSQCWAAVAASSLQSSGRSRVTRRSLSHRVSPQQSAEVGRGGWHSAEGSASTHSED